MASIFAVKIIIFLLGLGFTGLGVALFVLSNVGADPFTLFMQGLSNVFGITVGQSTIAISILYACIIFILDKRFIKTGMLISVISLGLMIDLFIFVFTPIFSIELMYFVRVLTMLTGTLFIALGIALVYSVKIGMVPNDALPIILADKVKLPFKWVRVSYDVLAACVGFMLGGVFGLGTLVCALAIGPLIAFFMPVTESFSEKWEQRAALLNFAKLPQ